VAFPSSTAVVGVALAALITWARIRLQRGLPRSPTPPVRSWKPAEVSLLLLLIGVALSLRLVGLGSRPIDNDEPVGLALRSLEAWATESDARLHPPFASLVMAWASSGTDVALARSVSVVAGIGSVALTFGVARRGGRAAALLAGLWMALAPAALHTSQLARGYSLLALFVLSSHVCLSRALAGGRSRWWVAYSASAALALGTEYIALAPLLAEALIVLRTRRAFERVGVVGSLGAALTSVAFLVPFAWPTLQGGVGGGPHAPTGAVRALSDVADLFSGAGAPFNAVLALVIVGVAARRRVLGEGEARLSAALASSVLLLVVASLWTLVRARYVLHAYPLFVALVSIAALRLGRPLASFVAVGLAACHVALIPGYYTGTAAAAEIGTGRRTPMIYELLLHDPRMPVAVTPEWAVAEPGYRLSGVFPGPDAGLDCPAELCLRGSRRVYGVRADSIARLLAAEPRFYLIDRFGTLGETKSCAPAIHEAGATLFLCARSLAPLP
jgi:hypothetical protein